MSAKKALELLRRQVGERRGPPHQPPDDLVVLALRALEKPERVWVLMYETKHGTDVILHDSRKGAEETMVQLIRQGVEEFYDEHPEAQHVLGMLEKGQLLDAQKQYEEDTGESFGIEERIVQREAG